MKANILTFTIWQLQGNTIEGYEVSYLHHLHVGEDNEGNKDRLDSEVHIPNRGCPRL